MRRNYPLSAICYPLCLLGLFLLSGCVVRTYPLTRERIDQDLTGNHGYLQGEAPAQEAKERKATRTTQVVEVEMHSPIKFERIAKKNKIVEYAEDKKIWGNRGFFTESAIPESVESAPAVSAANIEKYTVKKGDTLQKISNKFYGTTKRWNKIFEVNKDKLKAPNKIYSGQVIDIPLESLKETNENLK